MASIVDVGTQGSRLRQPPLEVWVRSGGVPEVINARQGPKLRDENDVPLVYVLENQVYAIRVCNHQYNDMPFYISTSDSDDAGFVDNMVPGKQMGVSDGLLVYSTRRIRPGTSLYVRSADIYGPIAELRVDDAMETATYNPVYEAQQMEVYV